jgi:RNA-directed DNA polymerase
VKIVTEINDGRYTPGIDGQIYKKGPEKVSLAESLRTKDYVPKPAKVVWIPKPGSKERRRLGIPTMRDRVMQMLILLAMNPEWESKFEPNSFGFRPGRSAIDAVHYIVGILRTYKGHKPHPGWILDADISKCFDNIDHDALLKRLETSPFLAIIKAWLKSGAVDRVGFKNTEKGTPQGGIISPLLANIALDGLERQFGIYTVNGKYLAPSQRRGYNKDVAVYRYADDFIVLAPSRELLETYVIPKVKAFLSSMGLDLNEAKTRTVNVAEGFSFLKFTFRRFYRKNGEIKCFTCTPNRERIDKFVSQLCEYAWKNSNSNVKELIMGLNRRIIGFCNYFKWSSAYRAFSYLSFRLWDFMWRWAKHKHYKRSAKWLHDRYWKTEGTSDWVFSFEGVSLVQPWRLTVQWWMWPRVRIHTSPYDPESSEYWKARRAKHD